MSLLLEAISNLLSRTSALLRIMATDTDKLSIDAGTLLSIVSLIVAILSTLVCVGQVLQQYISSGSPIRLCDSIVYGGRNGLPGQGTTSFYSCASFAHVH